MSKILGICGSLRAKSFNLSALKVAAEVMPAGMTLEITSIADLPLFNGDVLDAGAPAAAVKFRDAILAADGILIACPEYNWTIPGTLKNSIDWVSKMTPQPYAGKPVAILSATAGPLGGARAQYDLRKSLSCIDAMLLGKPEVFIGMAQTKFDADGKLTDEATRKILAMQMTAFEDWIGKVKKALV